MVTNHAYFGSITVENVRCFGPSQTLRLSDNLGRPSQWTLLMGDNGVGKTTLLQALASLLPDATALGHARGATPYYHPVYAEIVDWRSRAMDSGIPAARVSLRGTILFSESIDAVPTLNVPLDIWYRPRGHDLADVVEVPPLPEELDATVQAIGYGPFRRSGEGALTTEPSSSIANLFDDGQRLLNVEEWFLQRDYAAHNPRFNGFQRTAAKEARDRIAHLITTVLPDVKELVPRLEDAASGATRLYAKTPFGEVPVGQLGLGYQSTMAWVVDLAVRLMSAYPNSPNPLAEPAVCLIDEIDLHLHPKWQRTLFAKLSELFPSVQFIATAHSPLIVQSIPDVNVAVLRREGDHVVIDQRPRNVQQWRVDQILTSDLFDLPSARAPALDKDIARRDKLLAKSVLTKAEQAELDALREKLAASPAGESRAIMEAEEILLKAAREMSARNGSAAPATRPRTRAKKARR